MEYSYHIAVDEVVHEEVVFLKTLAGHCADFAAAAAASTVVVFALILLKVNKR